MGGGQRQGVGCSHPVFCHGGTACARHRHVPRVIYSAGKTKRVMLEAIARREDNERKHTAPGTVPYRSERKKHIVAVEE